MNRLNRKLFAKLCLVWFTLFFGIVLTTHLTSQAQVGLLALNIADAKSLDLDDQGGSCKVLKDFNFLVVDLLEYKPQSPVVCAFSCEVACEEFESVNTQLPRGPPNQSLT